MYVFPSFSYHFILVFCPLSDCFGVFYLFSLFILFWVLWPHFHSFSTFQFLVIIFFSFGSISSTFYPNSTFCSGFVYFWLSLSEYLAPDVHSLAQAYQASKPRSNRPLIGVTSLDYRTPVYHPLALWEGEKTAMAFVISE